MSTPSGGKEANRSAEPSKEFNYDFTQFKFSPFAKSGQSLSDEEREAAASAAETTRTLFAGIEDMIAVLSHAIQEAAQGEFIQSQLRSWAECYPVDVLKVADSSGEFVDLRLQVTKD